MFSFINFMHTFLTCFSVILTLSLIDDYVTFVVFDCGEVGQMSVRLSGDRDLAPGAIAGLNFDPARTVFFNADDDSVR